MPGAACVFLQVETDSGRGGVAAPAREGMQGEHLDWLPVPSPSPPGFGGLQSGGHAGLTCTLSSLLPWKSILWRALGSTPRVRPGLPQPRSPSAQVVWTC